MEAINKINERYYVDDLPLLFEKMDGQFYSLASKIFASFESAESNYADFLTQLVDRLAEKSALINRDDDIEYFMKQNAAHFAPICALEFESVGGDAVLNFDLEERCYR
jgi:hypothetical protein